MSGVGTGPYWGEPVKADPADVAPVAGPRRPRPRRRRSPRIRYRLGFLRRSTSLVELLILWAILAAVVSGIFAGIIAGVSLALHHVGG